MPLWKCVNGKVLVQVSVIEIERKFFGKLQSTEGKCEQK